MSISWAVQRVTELTHSVVSGELTAAKRPVSTRSSQLSHLNLLINLLLSLDCKALNRGQIVQRCTLLFKLKELYGANITGK